jgi:hypothetical protein
LRHLAVDLETEETVNGGGRRLLVAQLHVRIGELLTLADHVRTPAKETSER